MEVKSGAVSLRSNVQSMPAGPFVFLFGMVQKSKNYAGIFYVVHLVLLVSSISIWFVEGKSSPCIRFLMELAVITDKEICYIY